MTLDATRVLRVITRLNIGGPARQALLLSRDLKPDYVTTLVAGRPGSREGELTDPEVPITRAPLTRPVRPHLDAAALFALRRLMIESESSVVHSHMAKAGTLTRLAARSVEPRPILVHTFHGHVLQGYFKKPAERLFLEIERRLARHTDALIAVSSEIRDTLLELGVGDERRWHVISLGLDLDPFLRVNSPSGTLRKAIGIDAAVPLVGIVGRLVSIKDHRTLFDAVARLPGVHLAVIGDGEMRDELEREVLSNGLMGRVHFLGWWRQMPDAFSDLDVIALSSRNEGTPVSLIEGAAAGRPAVATDVGGVRSIINEGETGLLVPPREPQALAGALERLLDDAEARARMGEAAREVARTRFSKQRLLAEIRALYSSLIDERTHRV